MYRWKYGMRIGGVCSCIRADTRPSRDSPVQLEVRVSVHACLPVGLWLMQCCAFVSTSRRPPSLRFLLVLEHCLSTNDYDRHNKQVWMSYAQFEAKTDLETARSVFRRGYDHLRRQGLKEDRWVGASGAVRRANLVFSRCSCLLLLLFAGGMGKTGGSVFDRRWRPITLILPVDKRQPYRTSARD